MSWYWVFAPSAIVLVWVGLSEIVSELRGGKSNF
jgi:hypothetical protein